MQAARAGRVPLTFHVKHQRAASQRRYPHPEVEEPSAGDHRPTILAKERHLITARSRDRMVRTWQGEG
jgi:hypothetical protein